MSKTFCFPKIKLIVFGFWIFFFHFRFLLSFNRVWQHLLGFEQFLHVDQNFIWEKEKTRKQKIQQINITRVGTWHEKSNQSRKRKILINKRGKQYYQTTERFLYAVHFSLNLSPLSLNVNVMFSMTKISSTMSFHSVRVGGSGMSHLLVMAFLAADNSIFARYWSLAVTASEILPKYSTNCVKGIVYLNTFVKAGWMEFQNDVIWGQVQKMWVWVALTVSHGHRTGQV